MKWLLHTSALLESAPRDCKRRMKIHFVAGFLVVFLHIAPLSATILGTWRSDVKCKRVIERGKSANYVAPILCHNGQSYMHTRSYTTCFTLSACNNRVKPVCRWVTYDYQQNTICWYFQNVSSSFPWLPSLLTPSAPSVLSGSKQTAWLPALWLVTHCYEDKKMGTGRERVENLGKINGMPASVWIKSTLSATWNHRWCGPSAEKYDIVGFQTKQMKKKWKQLRLKISPCRLVLSVHSTFPFPPHDTPSC